METKDCVDIFISEKCKIDQSKSTLTKDLYEAYRKFCNEQNLRIHNSHSFVQRLINKLSLKRMRAPGGFYALKGISL